MIFILALFIKTHALIVFNNRSLRLVGLDYSKMRANDSYGVHRILLIFFELIT